MGGAAKVFKKVASFSPLGGLLGGEEKPSAPAPAPAPAPVAAPAPVEKSEPEVKVAGREAAQTGRVRRARKRKSSSILGGDSSSNALGN